MRRNNVRILNFQRWEVAISFHVDYVYLFVLPILEKLLLVEHTNLAVLENISLHIFSTSNQLRVL